jgi:branched-chain amino acid aminotransferase
LFHRHVHPVPTTTPRFEQLRDSAAFGAVFSDHVLVADYADGKWGEPVIVPYGPMHLPPAPGVAHYGQGIFEGFKAFPRPDGGAAIFRPDANHARMNRSCQRMAMPEIPASTFIDGTAALVRVDRQWIPAKPGSALYIRPVMFAIGEPLGSGPRTHRFIIETCLAAYFSGNVDRSRRTPTCGRARRDGRRSARELRRSLSRPARRRPGPQRAAARRHERRYVKRQA